MKSHSVLPGVCLSWVTTGPEQGGQACLQLRPLPRLTSRSLSASLHGNLRFLSDSVWHPLITWPLELVISLHSCHRDLTPSSSVQAPRPLGWG